MEAVMKNRNLILAAAFLIVVCFSVQTLVAQETSASEKEKELKLQQAIELQKKAMADVKKAVQDQQFRDLYKLRLDTMRNFGRGEGMNLYRSRGRNSGVSIENLDDPIVVQGMPFTGFYGHGGDSERTTLDYSQQVKESTFSKDFSFDVDKTSNNVIMTVMGDCKAGQIRVKILIPGGKVYSDILIDESGNLNWRKSFMISEDENKDKVGEWKFKIEADKATGFFKINLQTY
jgi:hypothetical protein